MINQRGASPLWIGHNCTEQRHPTTQWTHYVPLNPSSMTDSDWVSFRAGSVIQLNASCCQRCREMVVPVWWSRLMMRQGLSTGRKSRILGRLRFNGGNFPQEGHCEFHDEVESRSWSAVHQIKFALSDAISLENAADGLSKQSSPLSFPFGRVMQYTRMGLPSGCQTQSQGVIFMLCGITINVRTNYSWIKVLTYQHDIWMM